MKKSKISVLVALIIIVLFALIFPTPTASEEPQVPTVVAEEEVEIAVQEKNVIPKVLWDISWCESRNDQSAIGYNYHNQIVVNADGSTSTKRVMWSRDIGLFQVNEYYHANAAKAMGYDIYTVDGNTKYALYLYTKNGTSDWNASKACWEDIDAWRAKTKEPFYK